ncbi:Transposase, type 1 family-containing protein [Strongyloides ratti]|uniref:Transposase, type 1 family-containing protein n=1 Tax=Strongyloides ratti TaxID=34506 RepID=A0A090KQQ8_STRRB|nr:Transposase, type 1 family-containing protein [Strongyloides ratti]CEF59878.1 Transposase, type 1 family-containing protein [Strongyloides ratti]
MNKLEKRAVIKYLVKKGLTATEIFEDIKKVLEEDSLSYATIKRWVSEFKHGKTSLEDDPRSGRPKIATTKEIIEKVHEMIMNDRRLTVSEIAEKMEISEERTYHIITEELEMKKMFAIWVPNSLTIDQKRTRVQISKECLNLFLKDKRDFMRRFTTTNETWILYNNPELKEQSKEWKNPNSPPPKKVKSMFPSNKVMASIFWDCKGILLIDYLPNGQTITGKYYSNLLDQLDEKIREKRPGLNKKKIIFHQDNARAHTCLTSLSKISSLNYELLPHPLYSPDLASSDFFLFSKLKKFLSGK